MATPFIAQVSCFACNFAPVNWAFCNGQSLPIAQFDALYALIGTIYGGDGVTNFNLPDLRARSPMHWGNGPSGFNTQIGQVQGTDTVTLITSQMPTHNHTISSSVAPSNAQSERSPVPSGTAFVSASARPSAAWKLTPTTMTAQFSPKAIGITGGSQPHDNMQPYLVMNFCIATQGVFPSRN